MTLNRSLTFYTNERVNLADEEWASVSRAEKYTVTICPLFQRTVLFSSSCP